MFKKIVGFLAPMCLKFAKNLFPKNKIDEMIMKNASERGF